MRHADKGKKRYTRLPRIDLPNHAYFLTCCLDKRRTLFRNPRFPKLLLGLYLAQRDKGRLLLHAYVIMPDHYHILLSLKNETSISNLVRTVHSQFALKCREIMPIEGRVWQRRFYDHVIRDREDWEGRFGYVHNNPPEAGLVESVLDYPWSSCRFWELGSGPIECDGWA